MTWWVFSYLDNYRPPHALTVLARTEQRAHMFMKWSTTEPRRHMIWRRFRGTDIWCGYQYIWDTPNLVEQAQPGDTYEHLFGPIPLAPTDPVWYYLFSWFRFPTLEHQGPLIHVPAPEGPVPAARIFNSVDQPAAPAVSTIVQFDSVAYDDLYFYDPAQPDRFTLPMGGLFSIGANVRLATAAACKCSISITLNGPVPIAHHNHPIEATGWAGAALSLNTQLALRPGDFLQVRVYYMPPGVRDILNSPNYSPHFWIAMIGPYPVSPP